MAVADRAVYGRGDVMIPRERAVTGGGEAVFECKRRRRSVRRRFCWGRGIGRFGVISCRRLGERRVGVRSLRIWERRTDGDREGAVVGPVSVVHDPAAVHECGHGIRAFMRGNVAGGIRAVAVVGDRRVRPVCAGNDDADRVTARAHVAVCDVPYDDDERHEFVHARVSRADEEGCLWIGAEDLLHESRRGDRALLAISGAPAA